ncbi:N-acetyltransferase [Desulfolithobacter dissulfuricans]|uniref:N-acetyltransferase n=1 Tax=Desulfolithobacter dissulfuricans TaxID=2795293 RepID=A0A915TY10_9BACT|nr:GNAT family N-acetyltransferase [Desulfolithobacter dissulfuricans]BCO07859.1 N-acetyltransferase [Desulfolithobacter dissulfuricans]
MGRPQPFIIRPARAADLPALTALLELLFSIEEDFSFDEALQRQGLGLLLDSQEAVILVAELQDRVIGMCTGQLLISTAIGGPKVVVEDVVVLPGHHRCGVGSRLLEELAAWARRRGASRLQLLADRNNQPALGFYSHQGWHKTRLICLCKEI